MANCENCGSPTRTIKAGISKRTGKPYTAFQVCDSCNPPKPRQQSPQQKDVMLIDEIQALNSLVREETEALHNRLNSMGKFMQEEFKKINEKQDNLGTAISDVYSKLNEK